MLFAGEECSYSSDLNHTDGQNEHSDDDYDLEDAPTIILNPPCGATDRGKKENLTSVVTVNNLSFSNSKLHNLGCPRSQEGGNVRSGHLIGHHRTRRSHARNVRLRLHRRRSEHNFVADTGILSIM